jgi:hypothetical protein
MSKSARRVHDRNFFCRIYAAERGARRNLSCVPARRAVDLWLATPWAGLKVVE